MSETIDELLVKLGIDVDKQSFSEANTQFENVKDRAKLMGAALGIVGGAIGKLTMDFANQNDRLGKASEIYGTTTQFISGLGHALKLSGKEGKDAFSSIEQVSALLTNMKMGKFPEDAMALGFDSSTLEGVTDVEEAYKRIAKMTEGMNPQKAKEVLSALGFDDREITLFKGGTSTMQQYFKEAEQLAPKTKDLAENAERFNNSVEKLAIASEGLRDIVGNRLVEALLPLFGDTDDLVATRNRFEKAYESSIGAVADLFELMAKAGTPIEEAVTESAPAIVAKSFTGLAGGDFSIENIMGLAAPQLSSAINIADLDEIKMPDINGFFAGTNINTGIPMPQPMQSAVRYMRGDITITVDARGSTNPAETTRMVTEGVNKAVAKMAENAISETAVGLK